MRLSKRSRLILRSRCIAACYYSLRRKQIEVSQGFPFFSVFRLLSFHPPRLRSISQRNAVRWQTPPRCREIRKQMHGLRRRTCALFHSPMNHRSEWDTRRCTYKISVSRNLFISMDLYCRLSPPRFYRNPISTKLNTNNVLTTLLDQIWIYSVLSNRFERPVFNEKCLLPFFLFHFFYLILLKLASCRGNLWPWTWSWSIY